MKVFDDKKFRSIHGYFTSNLPETMDLLNKCHNLLIDGFPLYKGSENCLHAQKVLDDYVMCGGTFKETNE